MIRLIGFFAVALAVAACTSSAGFIRTEMTEQDRTVHDTTLKLRLKNYEAAQFLGEPMLAVNPKGGRLMCGAVNAQNGFGGYNGYQPYAVIYVPHLKKAAPILSIGALAAIDCRGAGLNPALPA